MVVEFDIRCYFTPSMLVSSASAVGRGAYKGWKQPFELCYRNSGNPASVVAEAHQYVAGQSFATGYYAPIEFIEVYRHFYQGRFATIGIMSKSDRDFFDLVNTEKWKMVGILNITSANPAVVTTTGIHHMFNGDHVYLENIVGMEQLNNSEFSITYVDNSRFELHSIDYYGHNNTIGSTYVSGGVVTDLTDDLPGWPGGYQMPQLEFPYRCWEINIKGKDTSYFSPALFRGYRTRVRDVAFGDVKQTDLQDALYRFELELMSFDAWNLKNDRGASTWYHRKNMTRDKYHQEFSTNDHITFYDMMVLVIAWMNAARPTEDFPAEYSLHPDIHSDDSPYNLYLDALPETNGAPYPRIVTESRATWDVLMDILDVMGADENAGKQYVPQCSIDGVISIEKGGFDKTEPAYEDFRTHEYIPVGEPGTTLTGDFTRIHAAYDIAAEGEYWWKFTLTKWENGNWKATPEVTIPASGYTYEAYDPNNIQMAKDIDFTKQPAGKYKWNLDIVSPYGLSVFTGGGLNYAASAPAYAGISSPFTSDVSRSEVDATQVQTYFMTRGACDYIRQTIPDGDGAFYTDVACPSYRGGYCPGQWGCYPDPIKNTQTTLSGLLTFTLDEANPPAGAIVTGVGTSFLTELIAGDLIKHNAGSIYHTVHSIQSNTSLTLESAFSDPCFLGNLVGISKKSGAISANEVLNPKFGLISSQPFKYSNQSSVSSWDTACRDFSKKMYGLFVDPNSTVREPINVHLEFVDGWNKDLVGKYCEYYSRSANKTIIFRVLSQTTRMQNGRVKTTMDGYRL